MKRILLVLMLITTISFAVGRPPTYWIIGSETFKLNESSFSPILSSLGPSDRTTNCSRTALNNIPYLACTYYEYTGETKYVQHVGTQYVIYFDEFTYSLDTNTCPSPSSIVNGECVEIDPLECNNIAGTFTNLDGQCTDCSSHLSDTDITAMANCACGATGSTYTPSSVSPQVPVGKGNFTYTQTPIKCADGTSKYVYYNKSAVADTNNTTPSDNNSSTDNNTTIPPADGNGTIPTDGNGTADGNGTKDGNGTGNGKDYTKYLETIVEKLTRIDTDTDNLSGINSGINGKFPVTDFNHNIPTDNSSSDWSNYAEAWNNIMNSLDEVTNSVGELQGLISNGFTSPFSKSSISSCSYTTSFDFGDVGSIPVTVDLCKVFSPLRGVIYTFTYLFFAFGIIYFHVKMFLRLV